MKKVFLHVGLHKTGSTFLQEKIFPHFKSTTCLTRPYTQHNYAFNKLQYADDSLYNKEDLVNELSRINSKKLLISDESLSGKPLNFGYINRSIIANRLKELFPEAKVMIFIRGQASILLSHYSQYVSQSGYKSIDELMWYPAENYTYDMYASNSQTYPVRTLYYNTNDFYLHLDCFLYFELISLYKKLFKQVNIFLYEDLKKHPEKTTLLIEDWLEEKINTNSKINLNKKINASISPENIPMKRFQNRMKVLSNNKIVTIPISLLYNLSLKKSQDLNFEKKYIHQLVGKFYQHNNAKVLHTFPEIRIDQYPEEYLV